VGVLLRSTNRWASLSDKPAYAQLAVDKTTIMATRQSGFGLQAGASGYPAVWDADESFGEAHALARLFIPLGWPTLAMRAGGQRSWGGFPLHESAFIGGRWSLRGFRWNRFAGDVRVWRAELRLPIAASRCGARSWA
jgi:hemolysin activation/secretion protein